MHPRQRAPVQYEGPGWDPRRRHCGRRGWTESHKGDLRRLDRGQIMEATSCWSWARLLSDPILTSPLWVSGTGPGGWVSTGLSDEEALLAHRTGAGQGRGQGFSFLHFLPRQLPFHSSGPCCKGFFVVLASARWPGPLDSNNSTSSLPLAGCYNLPAVVNLWVASQPFPYSCKQLPVSQPLYLKLE